MKTPITFLPWDTRFFGRRIARLKRLHLTPAVARAAFKACAKKRVECLYFLTSSDDSASVRCAEAHHFHLVDVRMTLSKEIPARVSSEASPLPAGMSYRIARASDIPSLQRLARTMFQNSRFALDRGFPPHSHAKLFAMWIAKSVKGGFDDWVGVAAFRGRLAGFVSCRRVGPGSGMIGLIGVGRAYRRRGIGRGLLAYAVHWFCAHRIRRISVATQGRALEAQRLYQESGFRTCQVDLWYHKWF